MASIAVLAAMLAAIPLGDELAEQTDEFGDPLVPGEAAPDSRATTEQTGANIRQYDAAFRPSLQRGLHALLPDRVVIVALVDFVGQSAFADVADPARHTRERDAGASSWSIGAVVRWEGAPRTRALHGAP